MMTKEPDTTPIALTSEPPVVSRGGGSKNAAVTEADTVMVTVIVVVMDAAVAMDVIVTVTVMDVIVTETVIAIVMVTAIVIVMVVVVVVEVNTKVALVLQMDAAKENIIAVHNIKRECPLWAFSFYFYNCAYYIIVMIEKGLLYACKAWLRCDECAFEECISISNDDVCTVSEIR